MSGKVCSSTRGSPSRTFQKSGMLSGASGVTKSSRPCARLSAATTSGESGPMSVEPDTQNGFFEFLAADEAQYVTRDGRLVIDDQEIRRKLISVVTRYTAIYRKGCTPPDSVAW